MGMFVYNCQNPAHAVYIVGPVRNEAEAGVNVQFCTLTKV